VLRDENGCDEDGYGRP